MSPTFRPIGDLCERGVFSIDPKREPEKEFWYIDISAVDNSLKQISTPQRVKGKAASVRARQIIRKNDVLVSTTRPNLNAVALIPEKYDGEICSTGFCVLRCGKELDPDYLFSFVQSQLFVGALSELVKGALYPAVTDKQVFAQLIPWQPIDDQRRIATHLKAQLAAAEEARRAAMARQSEFAKLRAALLAFAFAVVGGEADTLGAALLGIEAGKSFQTTEVLAGENELGILKVSAVSWTAFKPEEAKAVSGYKPDDTHRVRENDLLISRANTRELVGAVVLVEKDYPQRLLSDKTLRLIVNPEKADKTYLLYALRSEMARKHIEHFATGTSDSMRNISQGVILSVPILLPAIEEQRRISSQLKLQFTAVAEAETASAAQLADIERLPARLLAQAFNLNLE